MWPARKSSAKLLDPYSSVEPAIKAMGRDVQPRCYFAPLSTRCSVTRNTDNHSPATPIVVESNELSRGAFRCKDDPHATQPVRNRYNFERLSYVQPPTQGPPPRNTILRRS